MAWSSRTVRLECDRYRVETLYMRCPNQSINSHGFEEVRNIQLLEGNCFHFTTLIPHPLEKNILKCSSSKSKVCSLNTVQKFNPLFTNFFYHFRVKRFFVFLLALHSKQTYTFSCTNSIYLYVYTITICTVEDTLSNRSESELETLFTAETIPN